MFLPRITEEAKLYWEGTANRELRYQVCEECKEVVFPARSICPYCLSDSLKWVTSAGNGTIYSFSTIYRAPGKALGQGLPNTVVWIKLDEGFIMFSSITDCEPEDVYIDMPVKVFFERLSDTIMLPKFSPA